MNTNSRSPLLDHTSPHSTDVGVEAARLHWLISSEDDGSVSVVVLNLPGAGSCGETVDEGVQNAMEAAAGVVEEYVASGSEIPWRDSTHDLIPPGTKAKWVILDA